jgi:hypothetical protein
MEPLKMEPTDGSETSAALKLTPGKYTKEDIQHSKPDESLKSRKNHLFSVTVFIDWPFEELPT